MTKRGDERTKRAARVVAAEAVEFAVLLQRRKRVERPRGVGLHGVVVRVEQYGRFGRVKVAI